MGAGWFFTIRLRGGMALVMFKLAIPQEPGAYDISLQGVIVYLARLL